MKNHQRGEAILALMALCALAGLGWQMATPAAGTYSIVADNGSLIRTDTRTGAMQRCHVAGNQVTCETISAQR